MNIIHKLRLAAVAVGIIAAAGSAGYHSAPQALDAEPIQSISAESALNVEITVPNEHLLFPKPDVISIAAPPPKAVEVEPAPTVPAARNNSPVAPAVQPPVVVSVVPAAPAVSVAPVAPVPVAPEVSREVYVGLAGGQSVVDLGRGPVLFPLSDVSTPYVAEHDLLGGWERFGTLSAGMTARMSGLVTGTYTVGQIINVPKGGTTAEFRQFYVMPKVMLQTCVPGTSRMIVVGLY